MELRDHPDVQLEIDKAKRWVHESRQLTNDVSVESSLRRRIASALFLISIEHEVGILVLMDVQMIAPAKALIRSQFDAFVRGVWFLEKATEDQIREFGEKEFVKNVPPNCYERLVDEIETVERFSGGTFSRLKDTIYMLHDFTHGGKLAVSAYVTRNEISANFLPEDVVSCLRSSGVLGLMAANELAGMSGNEDLPGKVYQSHAAIYGDMHGTEDPT